MRAPPRLDLYDDGYDLVLFAEVPGASPEDVTLECEERRLVINGPFHRVVALPAPVCADEAHARLRDGVLEIHLPRQRGARPRRVPVEG